MKLNNEYEEEEEEIISGGFVPVSMSIQNNLHESSQIDEEGQIEDLFQSAEKNNITMEKNVPYKKTLVILGEPNQVIPNSNHVAPKSSPLEPKFSNQIPETSLAAVADKTHLVKHEPNYIPTLPDVVKPKISTDTKKVKKETDYEDESPLDDVYKRRYSKVEENQDTKESGKKKAKWLDMILN
jgi:hypothetical protein